MAKLKSLLKLCNTVFPFGDFLYILQLEEYSTKRLLKWLPKFFFRRNIQVRDSLVLTKRALITLLVSVAIWLGDLGIAIYLLRNSLVLGIITVIVFLLIIPFYVLVANFLFSLYEEIPKKKIRALAAKRISANKAMKVVAIAGSYGKTTVKNFVQQLTKASFKTQMIPGNINTPVGIANWIIRNLNTDTELLIAEVDAYEVGEIARSCDMLQADIAVLTNIGDQHLERFGTKEKLAIALSEVFSHSKQQSFMITNEYTKKEIILASDRKEQLHLIYDEETVTYQNLQISLPQLSASNKTNLLFALAVAEKLGVVYTFINESLGHLELPERRQQQTTVLGYDGIDDSYNISFSTAKMAISTALNLAKEKHKKLLVITAGIPELAQENKSKNRELGKLLQESADYTIILNSDFSHEIASGFTSKEKYIVVPTLKAFLSKESQNFKNTDWYLLFQPELNDLYY